MNCVKCGNENADDAKFCSKCGSQLNKPSPRNNLSRKTLIVMIIGVLLLIAVIVVVLSRENNGQNDSAEADTVVVTETSTEDGTIAPSTEDVSEEKSNGISSAEYILPESNSRVYTMDELSALSKEELRLARNEIFARHGRKFSSEDLQTHFSAQPWYTPIYESAEFDAKGDMIFNEFELANRKLIVELENASGSTVGAEISFTPDTFPRIDGSTATIPLSEQIAADTMQLPIEEARMHVLHNRTHQAYLNLIEGDADIIFVTSPSEEELQMAAEAGVELDIYPVVKEGFVFLVNEDNPVTGLTGQEIRAIYSGEITNWSTVGGKDAEIIPYQRPVNSGSQSGMLALVMKNTPLMKAPSHYYPGEMDGLVEAISSYDNAENAIGYSYYYFVSEMYFRKGIRLLAVDGVEPGPETIRNGSYPYTTAYYAVLRKNEPKESGARKLLEWLQQHGRETIEKAGYVPMS